MRKDDFYIYRVTFEKYWENSHTLKNARKRAKAIIDQEWPVGTYLGIQRIGKDKSLKYFMPDEKKDSNNPRP